MENPLEPIQRSEIEFNAKIYGKNKNSKFKRPRTAFTSLQLMKLESEFKTNQFLSRNRRILISQDLSLSEKQVKVWFQNRRMKSKKGNQKSITSSYTISSLSARNSNSSFEEHSKIVANLLSHVPRPQPITNWGLERTPEGFWKNMEDSFANFDTFPIANSNPESNMKISPIDLNGIHAYVSCGNSNEFQYPHTTQQEINSFNINYSRNQQSNSYSHQEFQTPISSYNTQWHEQYNINTPEYPLVTSAEHTITATIPKEVSYLQKFYNCKV